MSAKTQVTITLGRSGRVVKRAGASSEIAHSDYGHSLGGKRPAKERLGNHSNGCCNLSQNKRFKLMQKKMPRQTNIGSDMHDLVLHEKPLQTAQMPVRIDACRHESESKISRGLEQNPLRSTDDLPHMNSFGKSYFHWHLDRFQHKSPDSLLGAYRGVSPPRAYCNSLKQVPVVSSVDPPRLAPVLAKCVIEAPQPATFASKAHAPDKQPKPVMQLPLPSGILKTSYLAEEATSVDSLLHSLGLGKYAIHFEAEEVDMAALKQMGDNDLKELGIPMGPRKKILLAVSMHPRQQHAGEHCSRAPKTCGNASVL